MISKTKQNQKKDSLSEQNFIHSHLESDDSSVKIYAKLVIGEYSIWKLLRYEMITTLFGWIPGALGLALRKIFFRMLFTSIGKGVIFGRNLTLRNTAKMVIGSHVVIDDGAFLDARGAGPGEFVIEDNVLIGSRAVLQSKAGGFHVGKGSNIGSSCLVISQGGIDIANDVFIGGGCMLSGGLFSLNDCGDDVIFDRSSKGPIKINERCILGMGSIVIDNVNIGSRSLIGAGVTVIADVPEDCIVSSRAPITLKKGNF